MSITFDGEAREVFERLAESIPAGYIVALLREGEEPSLDGYTTDVEWIGGDALFVRYHPLDSQGEADRTVVSKRPWESIDRIHIY